MFRSLIRFLKGLTDANTGTVDFEAENAALREHATREINGVPVVDTVQPYSSFTGKDITATVHPGQMEGTFSRSYNSFSGVDVKIELHCPQTNQQLSLTEMLKYTIVSKGNETTGTLRFVIFDRSVPRQIREFMVEQGALVNFNLEFVAANEYGCIARQTLEDVEFEEYRSELSIDDLITEEQLDFTAEKFRPWWRVDLSVDPYERTEEHGLPSTVKKFRDLKEVMKCQSQMKTESSA